MSSPSLSPARASCEYGEPLHAPAAIQPHGVVLVLSVDDWRVLQTSTNCKQLLGLSPSRVLGKRLPDLFGDEAFARLEPSLTRATAHSLRTGAWESGHPARTRRFHTHTYPSGGRLVLELEPAELAEEAVGTDLHDALHSGFVELAASPDLLSLCAEAGAQIRALTGFDRVMVYRFDSEWNGEVVAESRADHSPIDSYLGLHFPASDIPFRARELFMLTGVRTIPDVGARVASLVPECDPETGEPLDMSRSLLRAVLPIHIEYLQNMEVAGSLAIAIIRRGTLWGLVACHHLVPRHVSRSLRIACKIIGQLLSLELTAREDARDTRYLLELKAGQASFLEAVARHESVSDGLLLHQPTLLNRIEADGVALKLDGRTVLLGKTPPLAQVEGLFSRLSARTDEAVWATDDLCRHLGETEDTLSGTSGVLAMLLPGSEPRGVMWMREENLQTVSWGGDPSRTVEIDPADGQLHPRASFALWKEQVRGRSVAWQSCELEAANQLRAALIGLLLLSSERAAHTARRALELSEERFESFLELSPTLAFIKDVDGRLLFASRLFAERFGIAPEQWRGKTDDQLWPAEVALQIRTSDLTVLEVDEPLELTEVLPLPDGELSQWLTVKFPIPNLSGGKLLASMAIDITGRRAVEAQMRTALREKEVLLREIHHRVKNNLQVVASLLKLQERQTANPTAIAVLAQSQDRVRSMALIHEHLHLSTSLARAELASYLKQLSDSLLGTYGGMSEGLQFSHALAPIQADLDTAVPLGLIANELMTNAIKHAFVDGRQGQIHLELSLTADGSGRLVISDNGVSLPLDLDIETTRSLGLRLVRSLTRQLDGTLEVSRESGTRFELIFPLKPVSPKEVTDAHH